MKLIKISHKTLYFTKSSKKTWLLVR